MKVINSYIKSLKFVNHLILTIPSSPTLPASTGNQLSSFYTSCKIAESRKDERKN